MPERLHPLAQPGTPRVVFEAHHLGCAVDGIRSEDHVADEAPLARLGEQRQGTEEVHARAVGAHVVLAEQLVSPAYGQDRHVSLDGLAQASRLRAGAPDAEIVHEGVLVEVLAAAYEKEVELGKIGVLAGAQPHDLALDATPRATPLQRDGVAPVSVEVQDVRIEMADFDVHVQPSQNPARPSLRCAAPRKASMAE